MRTNLTKKDLVNIIYMHVGFSKQMSEHLIDEFFSLITLNLKNEKKLKLTKFGTFFIKFSIIKEKNSSIRVSEICFEKPICI